MLKFLSLSRCLSFGCSQKLSLEQEITWQDDLTMTCGFWVLNILTRSLKIRELGGRRGRHELKLEFV